MDEDSLEGWFTAVALLITHILAAGFGVNIAIKDNEIKSGEPIKIEKKVYKCSEVKI